MPKVLLLCEYATLNGGERSMLATLEGVCVAGFEAIVAAPPQGPLAEALRARGIEVLPFQAADAAGQRLPQPRLRQELGELLARVQPDLLHANSLAMGRLSGPVAAEAGVPSIAHLRDILRLSLRAIADLNRHVRLLAVSNATRDFHAAAGLAALKLHVLYNGVDLVQFRPRPATGYIHRLLGLPQDVRLLGTVGQIGLRKGQDVLVRAAGLLAEALPDVHYLIVGERYSEKDESRRFEAGLRRRAEQTAGRFHFLGFRGDVPQVLNELAVLVHPARQEPLGRVLLEAAASGLPIVATDVGGTREIFPPDSHSAILVPPDDPGALTAATLAMLGDVRLRASTGTAARRRAEEAFDIRSAGAKLVGHYREVLSLSPWKRNPWRRGPRDPATRVSQGPP